MLEKLLYTGLILAGCTYVGVSGLSAQAQTIGYVDSDAVAIDNLSIINIQ